MYRFTSGTTAGWVGWMQKDTYQWLFDGDAVPMGAVPQQRACALLFRLWSIGMQ
jgi:hypothetical protein